MGGFSTVSPPYAPIIARTTYTTTFSTTSTTEVDVTGLSVSVTLSKTSDVFVYVHLSYVYNSSAGYTLFSRIYRGTTLLKEARCGNPSANNYMPLCLQVLGRNVAPGTYTYKLRGFVDGGTGYWAMGMALPGEIVVIVF